MSYTLFYISNEIKQGTVNYQNETVSLSIETHLHGSDIWTVSIERALRAVYDGLDATKRKDTWGLANWPQRGVTNLNAFARRNQSFSVVFELLNDQNKVIGRQTLQSGGSWGLNWSGRPTVEVNADQTKTLNFQNVNANDISDRMTIRIATVNGTDAETAARNGVLQIRTITRNEFNKNSNYKFSRCELRGFTNNAARDAETAYKPAVIDRNSGTITSREIRKFVIPNIIWGDPVTSIGNGAFNNIGLTELTISGNITSIGNEAFRNNRLRSVTIPNSVTSIGEEAFSRHQTEQTDYGRITSIIIGANVNMARNAFRYSYRYYDSGGLREGVERSFEDFYDSNGKKAGTYEMAFVNWKYKP
jgi:hypothetical protein